MRLVLEKIKIISKKFYAIFEDIRDPNLRISVIITLGLILAGALIYGVKNIGYSKEVLWQKANAYYMQERFFLAAKYFSKVAELDRGNPQAYFSYAVALTKLGNFNGAIRNFKKAVNIDPGNAEIYYYLGNAYYQQASLLNNSELFAKAENTLAKAIELNPNLEKAYLLIGVCFRANAKMDKARAWYRKALLEGNFSKAGFYNLIGHTFFEEKRYKEAAAYYERAIANDYAFIAAYCNLGDMYVLMGDTQAALEKYKKVIEINDELAIGYVKIAEIYYNNVEYDEVLNMCAKALAVNPDDAKANYLAGMVYKVWGRDADAFAYLEKAAYYGNDEAVVELRRSGVDLR
ncbi:tetratricopeptide repeat protein [Endomicrobium proavitum]|uniref:Uncharacterized protein n=1 Tax=Endomicrobium proavitum TaxID=1408281 RepID=A0A0G3WKG2_9BACT|nr:tetratricopeptide repeat protein [Endomicrobium proavitum]AKL98395.1 hypothetical protein Epro_1016 [Endomicrobium proavitum]